MSILSNERECSERWALIPGYDGRYAISDHGRVKSFLRWDVTTRSYIPCERLLTPTDNGYGYLVIMLRLGTLRKSHYIHRLVADAFVDNVLCLPCVNHKDFNKKNNAFWNLEWVTQGDNVRYSAKRMIRPHNNRLPTTGERYIHKRKNSYEVSVHGKYIGSFRELHDAVCARDEAMKGVIWWHDQF